MCPTCRCEISHDDRKAFRMYGVALIWQMCKESHEEKFEAWIQKFEISHDYDMKMYEAAALWEKESRNKDKFKKWIETLKRVAPITPMENLLDAPEYLPQSQ